MMKAKMQLLMISYQINKAYRVLLKGPPGPPPRPHLEWHEETKRWWCGEGGCELRHRHESVGDYSDREISAYFDEYPDKRLYPAIRGMHEEIEDIFDPHLENTYQNPMDSLALEKYISDERDDDIGRKMRNGEPLNDRQKKEVSDLYEMMTPMQLPYTVYRGMYDKLLNTDGDPAQIDDIVTMDMFTSTSRSPLVAKEFSQAGKGVFMEILTSNETLAITLSNEDTPYQEHETILAPSRYRVVDRRDDLNYNTSYGFPEYLVLEDLGPAQTDWDYVED